MCEYNFFIKGKCREKSFDESGYCILHVDLPPKENNEQYNKIAELKKLKIEEKIAKGEFDFEGVKLPEFKLVFGPMAKFPMEYLILDKAVIKGSVVIDQVDIKYGASFRETDIGEGLRFIDVKIGRGLSFEEAKISGFVLIEKTETFGETSLTKAKVAGPLVFRKVDALGGLTAEHVEIHGSAEFTEVKVGKGADFYGAKIYRNGTFSRCKIDDLFIPMQEIGGELSFYGTKFTLPKSEERACRKAKATLEQHGDNDGEDYHFYREMVARRKQKHWYVRYPELLIQYLSWYGVHPSRVFMSWLSVAFALSFLYWFGSGVQGANSYLECLYFSIMTVVALGDGVYSPTPGTYQMLASAEAIFGTFMWAAFIITFARKYMR